MRRTRLPYILILLFIAAVNLSSKEIRWYVNFDEAKKVAFDQNKLMILFFEAGSTDWSYKMISETWNQPSVIEAAQHFVCVRIDFEQMQQSRNILMKDRNQQLVVRYRVTYIPTTVVIDVAGNDLLHITDFITDKELAPRLRALPRNLDQLYPALKQLEKTPEDVGLKILAGDSYQLLNLPVISNRYYEDVADAETLLKDHKLGEHVAFARATNFHLMGQLHKSIDLCEQILDQYPESLERPKHLYTLVKLCWEDANEIRSTQYYTTLKTRYPNSQYTKLAREIVEPKSPRDIK